MENREGGNLVPKTESYCSVMGASLRGAAGHARSYGNALASSHVPASDGQATLSKGSKSNYASGLKSRRS